MKTSATIQVTHGQKTYRFEVVLTPDKYVLDGSPVWAIECPALKDYGAYTQGDTQEEALAQMHGVIKMIFARLERDGEPLPER